jgi:hypothetical protein
VWVKTWLISQAYSRYADFHNSKDRRYREILLCLLRMFGRFGRELVRLLAMCVDRRDVFLLLVVIVLIVLAGSFVAMMCGGGVVAGSPNVSFRSGMVGSGTYSAVEAVRASQCRHWSSRCASEAWRRCSACGAADFART